MNFIVYDLEATCWLGRPPNDHNEVIEIGAYKLNQYGEVTGKFSRFVKPKLNPILSPFCKRLTSIEQKDIDRAEKYPKVIEDWQDWCEIFDVDCLFCSWGNFDKTVIVDNCELHKMESDWILNHMDIKTEYTHMKKLAKPCGLKRAVLNEGFEFTGHHHRGIADAENLAKIVAKYVDEWAY